MRISHKELKEGLKTKTEEKVTMAVVLRGWGKIDS